MDAFDEGFGKAFGDVAFFGEAFGDAAFFGEAFGDAALFFGVADASFGDAALGDATRTGEASAPTFCLFAGGGEGQRTEHGGDFGEATFSGEISTGAAMLEDPSPGQKSLSSSSSRLLIQASNFASAEFFSSSFSSSIGADFARRRLRVFACAALPCGESSTGIDGFVGRAVACTACTGLAACGATAERFPPSSSLDCKALSVYMKEAMLHVMRGDKMLRLVSPTPTHYH